MCSDVFMLMLMRMRVGHGAWMDFWLVASCIGKGMDAVRLVLLSWKVF